MHLHCGGREIGRQKGWTPVLTHPCLRVLAGPVPWGIIRNRDRRRTPNSEFAPQRKAPRLTLVGAQLALLLHAPRLCSGAILFPANRSPEKPMDHYGKQGQAIGVNYPGALNMQAQANLSQQICDAPPRNRSALDEIGGRLAGAVHQTALLMDALATLEGRLMGGCAIAGAGAKEAQGRPVPSGFVGQTNMVLDELFARLETCGHTLSRLSDAI